MARIRTIKPEFWTDSKTVGLSALARLLFIGAWNFADDYGALEADSMQLKLRVLPAEPCDANALVDELLDAGLLIEMTNGYETFWIVAGWEKHQKVDKRSKSQFGDPDSWSPAEPSPNHAEPRRIPPSPGEPSRALGLEGKGKEGICLAPEEPARKPKKPRKRDEIFDALVEECGLDPDQLTSSARGRVNKAAKELRDIGATPDGIRARAKVHRDKWPTAELTPTSLSTNYAQLATRPPPTQQRRTDQVVGSPEYEARVRQEQQQREALIGGNR